MFKTITCLDCGIKQERHHTATLCFSCVEKRQRAAQKMGALDRRVYKKTRVQALTLADIETPELIAGTDHRADNLRCLREGIHATLRKVKEILAQ